MALAKWWRGRELVTLLTFAEIVTGTKAAILNCNPITWTFMRLARNLTHRIPLYNIGQPYWKLF